MEGNNAKDGCNGVSVRPDITVEHFSEHIKLLQCDDNQRYKEEFATLCDVPKFPKDDALHDCNIRKNRYPNYCPWFIWKQTVGTDYINASWINGYNKQQAYIATQGPLKTTIGDFWRMVWVNNIPTVVMVTRLVDKGQVKCEQYWSDWTDKPFSVSGGLEVCLVETRQLGTELRERTFLLNHVSRPGKSLTVTQFHFTGWPDHGVPTSSSLLNLIGQVRQTHPHRLTRPLLVHCSAGVGRTGTFIALDILMQQAQCEGGVNVFATVKALRMQRPRMVDNMVQYMFIHDTLSEFIVSGLNHAPTALPSDDSHIPWMPAMLPAACSPVAIAINTKS